jgi:hypothetical protein
MVVGGEKLLALSRLVPRLKCFNLTLVGGVRSRVFGMSTEVP